MFRTDNIDIIIQNMSITCILLPELRGNRALRPWFSPSSYAEKVQLSWERSTENDEIWEFNKKTDYNCGNQH